MAREAIVFTLSKKNPSHVATSSLLLLRPHHLALLHGVHTCHGHMAIRTTRSNQAGLLTSYHVDSCGDLVADKENAMGIGDRFGRNLTSHDVSCFSNKSDRNEQRLRWLSNDSFTIFKGALNFWVSRAPYLGQTTSAIPFANDSDSILFNSTSDGFANRQQHPDLH